MTDAGLRAFFFHRGHRRHLPGYSYERFGTLDTFVFHSQETQAAVPPHIERLE